MLTNYQRSFFPAIKNNKVIYNGRPELKKVEHDYIFEKLDASKKIIGACAYIVKRKGFYQVLEFLASDYGSDFIFVLVGDGPELKRLNILADELGVKERFITPGKTFDIASFVCGFDIFIMSSSSEGMPLSILEAASLKSLVVSTSLPVIKEVFDGSEISYYEYGDLNSFTNAIKIGLQHKFEFKNNIYDKYKSCFTDEIMSNKYCELYSND
nr:glycosyltransferase [Aliivibrio fischeri]